MFLQQDGRRPGLIQLAVRPQASPSDSLTPNGRGGRLHRDPESVGANSPETGKCPVPQCKRKAALQRKLDACELLRRKWQEILPGVDRCSSLQDLKKEFDKYSTEDG